MTVPADRAVPATLGAPAAAVPASSSGPVPATRPTARTGAAGGPAPELRVMSYNVHGLTDDRAALAGVVRECAPDVLIVQEAPRRFRWRGRCADLAHAFGMFYAAGGLPSLGNVIMTSQRVRVVATRCLRYPLTPGRHMRGAVFARCELGRSRFAVAGSHLSTDAAERPAQARLLKHELSAAAAAEPVSLLLGADVNEVAGGPSFDLLADGLVDAGAGAGAPTFPADGPRRRIDAIMVDPRCQIIRVEVPDSARIRRASDHLPIVCDVVLPMLT